MPYTVLQSAAEGGHKSVVRLFCAPEHGLAQIGQRIRIVHAVVTAARGGHEAIVKYPVQEGTGF